MSFFFFFKKSENSFLFGLAGSVEDKKTLEWMCGPPEPQKPLSLFHMVWSAPDGISDCGSDSWGWGDAPEWKRRTSKSNSQIQVKFAGRSAEAGGPLRELAWSSELKSGQISNEPKMSYGFRCRSRGKVPAVFLFKQRVKSHMRQKPVSLPNSCESHTDRTHSLQQLELVEFLEQAGAAIRFLWLMPHSAGFWDLQRQGWSEHVVYACWTYFVPSWSRNLCWRLYTKTMCWVDRLHKQVTGWKRGLLSLSLPQAVMGFQIASVVNDCPELASLQQACLDYLMSWHEQWLFPVRSVSSVIWKIGSIQQALL